jgi:hypothetical protein
LYLVKEEEDDKQEEEELFVVLEKFVDLVEN